MTGPLAYKKDSANDMVVLEGVKARDASDRSTLECPKVVQHRIWVKVSSDGRK